MRVALAQVDSILGDTDENLRHAKEVVAEAKVGGADLVVFPELSLSGYAVGELDDEVPIKAHSKPIYSLAEAAGETAVVVGFCEEGRDFQTYNSAAYLEDGNLLHLHRKLYYQTTGSTKRGNTTTRTEHARLRHEARPHGHADLQRRLATVPTLIAVQDGAQVLIIPADSGSYPYPELLDTKEYWRDITRFYARMLESYVIFTNRVGKQDNLFSGATRTSSTPGDGSWRRDPVTKRP
jgi:predicted amidohydrolase